MRRLLLIIGMLFATISAFSQEIAFRDTDVIQLARLITLEARHGNQLPPSYTMTMLNAHPMVITNANAFELLARAIAAWKSAKTFPSQVSLLVDDLSGPAFDPKYEPKRDGLTFYVPLNDIGLYAPFWLAKAEAPGHKLLAAWNFESGYRLTAAQLLVAMAALIDETVKAKELPQAVMIPLVRSPQNWQETRMPVTVAPEAAVTAVAMPAEPALQVKLNGIEMSERGPLVLGKGLPPFCGPIRIEVAGYGPIVSIRLMLDKDDVKTVDGVGPFFHALNSLLLTDGAHTLSAIATDTRGKTFAYIFSFTVMNGRAGGFTPAEPEEKVVDAVPG